METNGTGGSKSPEFILHVASWLTCRWRSERLEDTAKKKKKQNKAKKKEFPLVRRGRSSEGISLGSDCKRERRRHCCQSVQKYSPVYCWNMKPFFLSFFTFTFSVCCRYSPFFKFRNIASSLFLPIRLPPLTFLFFSFLIYIYIYFLAAFFFFLFYYFTKMRDRMMDG